MLLNYDVFRSLKVVLILANCADTDEMYHFAGICISLANVQIRLTFDLNDDFS